METLISEERLEFKAGRSDKFYTWRLFDCNNGKWRVAFNWGRNGTVGQYMTEIFDDVKLARWKIDVKRRSKLDAGYQSVSIGTAAGTYSIAAPTYSPTYAKIGIRPKTPSGRPPGEREQPIETVRRVRLRD